MSAKNDDLKMSNFAARGIHPNKPTVGWACLGHAFGLLCCCVALLLPCFVFTRIPRFISIWFDLGLRLLRSTKKLQVNVCACARVRA